MENRLSVHSFKVPGPGPLKHFRDLLDPGVCLSVGPTLPENPDYHVLVAVQPDREHLIASPNLHTLIIPLGGVPHQTCKLMHEFPQISVHNLHHSAGPVAEMAVTLLLAAAKCIVPNDRALRSNDWSPRYRPNPWTLLEGKKALVLGYGAIGRRVAGMCRGLGMGVMATRRSTETLSSDCPDDVYPSGELHNLLPRANALIICLPLTDETEGLIGKHELALLPKGATLVNVSRGPVVDEEALFQALQGGSLYAAGLDVWYNLPDSVSSRVNTPPSTYPFHELDNVVLSPHIAGGVLGAEDVEMRSVTAMAQLINAAARGETLPSRVDVRRGY
jgi:phosphoglycerate dehydrogenase-like enzyme